MSAFLLTRNIFRNCKFKVLSCQVRKLLSTRSDATPAADVEKLADPQLVEICPSWPETEKPQLRHEVLRDMQVFPDFVSEAEEAALMAEVEPVLKRMRYEYDHWDNAIEGFRETERVSWQPHNAAVLERVRQVSFTRCECEVLPHTHVLDLAAAGHIKPHVDAVRFCGATIAGISLLSSAVMRLQHSTLPHASLIALLPRRSLYVMTGVARHVFSHEVVGGAASVWRGEKVPRLRRVALITRSKPSPAAS